MRRTGKIVWQAVRICGAGVLTLSVWTLWLALAIVLAAQIYVATTHEFALPDFVLRRLEQRLAESGLRATFRRTSFDPTGRILIEDVSVFLPDYADPVITARAGYLRLNPWSLLHGKFEAREIRLNDAAAWVPAILSPSGRSEPILRDLDATVFPDDRNFVVSHLSARLGELIVSAHGNVSLRPRTGEPSPQFATFLREHFPTFCREAIAFAEKLDRLDHAALDLKLESSETRAAIVSATLLARGFKLETPLSADLGPFELRTRFPLVGDAPAMSRLEFTTDGLRLPYDVVAGHVRAVMRGRLRPAQLHFDPVELELTAESVAAAGFSANHLSAVLRPQPLPRLEMETVALAMGAPIAVTANADFSTRMATIRWSGAISPRVLDPISARVHVDVRKFFDFETLECDTGEARLGPDWQFQNLAAQVALRGIHAHGVTMEEGRAIVQFDGRRLFAPEAYARIGENFARGSYEHEIATREFRFLLEGRLRPLAISEWFHEWWPNFFARFEFPISPPNASVDVRGVWRESRESAIFVWADADKPTIQGEKLDRVRTRLFIRPGFYDGLELHAIQPGGGSAQGTFTFTTNLETEKWRALDLNLVSTLAPETAAHLIGPTGSEILTVFQFARPPMVKLHGHLDGPDVDGARHRTLDLEAQSAGPFRFFDFPLESGNFTAIVRDDEITLQKFDGHFAGGTAIGHARLWAAGADQRLSFEGSITDASLGLAVGAVQAFSAARKHQPAPPPGKFVQEKINVRLDLKAAAEGLSKDPFSFHGEGKTALRGAQIGEVALFGALSDLLKFTALRFTSAQSSIKINGAKLEFPDVTLRGANSAIDAHGDYALERRELDFKAKIYPFQESGNVLKTVVGAVLTPFSSVFEVKLTGSLEKPDWAFVMGPTNFIRSLAPGTTETTPAAATAGGVLPTAPVTEKRESAPKKE
jgi:hypothetical protein